MSETVDQNQALKLMRKPFEPHQISKMCKSTKRDNPAGKCKDCGGFHKLPSVQLSYVGHAALTDRLLDADPNWAWEPLAYAPDGTPFLDKDGGLWIKLTVAGVTRLGYGDAQGKVGGDAMKERIGDALRNAAMRFGAALDLWHKGDLHGSEEEDSLKFENKGDGTFVKSTETVQPTKSPEPTKRGKKKTEPSDYQPWGGLVNKPQNELNNTKDFGNIPAIPIPAVGNIHGLDIKNEDVPFPGDPEPTPVVHKTDNRVPTDVEAKGFRERLIKIKDRGYMGLGQWILKKSGKTRTQDIPYEEIARIVDEVEKAEAAGTLKEMLAQ